MAPINPFNVAPGKNPLASIAPGKNPLANMAPAKNPLAPQTMPQSTPVTVGVQAKAPVTPTPSNKLPANQVKPAVSQETPTNTSNANNSQNQGSFQNTLNDIQSQALKVQSSVDQMAQQPQYQPQYQQPQMQQQGGGGLYGALIAALAGQGLGNGGSQELIGQLAGMGVNENPAYDKAVKNLQDFQGQTAQEIAGWESDPIAAVFQQGRAGAVARQAATTQGALQQAIANSLQGQGLQQSALGTALTGQISSQGLIQQALQQAAGLSAPTQVPFTNQFISPITGQPVQQGGMQGGNLNPLNSIGQYAQMVANGQMSPSQAYSALGNNPAFTSALNSAIFQINPNANLNQLEANAAAQGQALSQANQLGGDLQKRGQTVIQHIQELEDSFKAITSTGSPALNAGLNILRKIYPTKEFSDFNTALENVRGELAGIFSVGGTPTAGEAMARSILPDNITPNQVAGAIARAKPLIEQKIASYSVPTPAQYGTGQSGGGSGSIFDF